MKKNVILSSTGQHIFAKMTKISENDKILTLFFSSLTVLVQKIDGGMGGVVDFLKISSDFYFFGGQIDFFSRKEWRFFAEFLWRKKSIFDTIFYKKKWRIPLGTFFLQKKNTDFWRDFWWILYRKFLLKLEMSQKNFFIPARRKGSW